MSNFLNVASGLYGVLLKYPAIAAGLANIAVVMAATFGFKLTADQVVSAVSFSAAILGVLIHYNVIPMHKAKQGDVPAEVKQAVKAKDAPTIHVEASNTDPDFGRKVVKSLEEQHRRGNA